MTNHLNWTDHLSWTDLPQAIKETAFWVQGYIRALNDVIGDLEVQRDGYLNDPDAQHALEMTLEKVQGTLMSAQQTLDTLHEIMKEDDGG